jgi:hypothetical protein
MQAKIGYDHVRMDVSQTNFFGFEPGKHLAVLRNKLVTPNKTFLAGKLPEILQRLS